MDKEEILLEIRLSYNETLKGISELTVANENLSKQIKEQKELFKSLKDVTDDEKKAKLEAAAALSESEAEYKKNTETLKIYQGVLIENMKYEEDIKNSYSQLSEQMTMLTDTYNNMSDAERQSATGQELQQKISDIASSMNNLTSVYSNNIKEIGTYKTESAQLRGELSTLAGQMVKLTKENKTGSKEFDDLGKEALKLKLVTDTLNKTVNESGEEQKTLAKQLKETKEQMQQLAIEGKTNTDEYKLLAVQAGELKHAINSVNIEMKLQANGALGLDVLRESVKGLAGAYGVWQSASAMLGVDNKELDAVMKSLTSTMTMILSINTLYNSVIKQGGLLTKMSALFSKQRAKVIVAEATATTASTTATKGATVAQAAFNKVAWNNPYIIIAAAIALAAIAIAGATKETENATKSQEKQNEKLKEYLDLITGAEAFLSKKRQKVAKDDEHTLKMMKLQGAAQEDIIRKERAILQQKIDNAEYDKKTLGMLPQDYEKVEDSLRGVQNQLKTYSLLLREGKTLTEAQVNEMEMLEQREASLLKIAQKYLDTWNAVIYAHQELREYDAKLVQDQQKEEDRQKEERRKNAEKAKQERIAAEQKIQDITVALMEEGREKELQQLENNLNRELEAVKGSTEQIEEQRRLLREKYNKETAAIEEKYRKEEYDKAVEAAQAALELRLELAKEGSQAELDLTLQKLDREMELEIQKAEELGIEKQLIYDKYDQLRKDANSARIKAIYEDELEQSRIKWETEIAEATLRGEQTLQLKLQQKEEELRALQELEATIDEEGRAELILKQREMAVEIKQIQDEIAQNQIENSQRIKEAYASMFGAMSNLLGQWAEDNEAMAVFSKLLALTEVGINTAKAISGGIAAAQSVPYPANLVAIVTTITSVLASMAQATSILKKSSTPKAPKMARGGLVKGFGSGTSDNVPTLLSNGEGVMTAAATSMFAPLLSQLNMAGGGIPIQAADTAKQAFGEDMLSRAFAKALVAMPNPVVTVDAINKGQGTVEVREDWLIE